MEAGRGDGGNNGGGGDGRGRNEDAGLLCNMGPFWTMSAMSPPSWVLSSPSDHPDPAAFEGHPVYLPLSPGILQDRTLSHCSSPCLSPWVTCSDLTHWLAGLTALPLFSQSGLSSPQPHFPNCPIGTRHSTWSKPNSLLPHPCRSLLCACLGDWQCPWPACFKPPSLLRGRGTFCF